VRPAFCGFAQAHGESYIDRLEIGVRETEVVMSRLLKLVAYGVLGYAVYELWQGMREGGQRTAAGRSRFGAGARTGAPGGRDLRRALNEDPGRMMNMTGTGRGTTVSTEESGSGQSVPHLVGRGVVQP
jgi:hypothetical protein